MSHLTTWQPVASIHPLKSMMHIEFAPHYFHEIEKFLPCFSKIKKCPYILIQFTFFYLIYILLVPFYFDCDAFMNHALHVLDATEESLLRC